MKKGIAIIAAAIMIMAMSSGFTSANAENTAKIDLTQCSVYNGHVQSTEFFDIVAPCSGVLEDFDLSVGDVLAKGEEAFCMMTTDVFAPEAGTVLYAYADEGDQADAVTTKYGGVIAIQPRNRIWIECSYSGCYDSDECKEVFIGQTLFFTSNKEEGRGVVVNTIGNTYQIEVTEGKLARSERVHLYLDEAHLSSKRTGTGYAVIRDAVLVPATGVVDSFFVEPGDAVEKGDKLLSLLTKDADYGASSVVKTEIDGAVTLLPVSPGQQVWKGQLLARVSSADSMEIVAEVNEADVMKMQIGDHYPVTLDSDMNLVLEGTVTKIAGFGTIRQNATYYAVHLEIPNNGTELMIGQSASVYIP